MTYYLTPFGANPTFSVSWTPTQTWATATASGTTATMNMTPQTIQYGITNDQAGQTQSSSWPGYGSQSQPATSSFTQQIWVSDLSDLEVFQDWLMDQSRTLNMFKSHLEDILRMAEWKEFTSSVLSCARAVFCADGLLDREQILQIFTAISLPTQISSATRWKSSEARLVNPPKVLTVTTSHEHSVALAMYEPDTYPLHSSYQA